MIIGLCEWCGCEIEGDRELLGCRMICKACEREGCA
jgi:hypothetical protein